MLHCGGFTLERAGSLVVGPGDVGKWFVRRPGRQRHPPPTAVAVQRLRLPASGREVKALPARLREGRETCRSAGEVSRSGVGIERRSFEFRSSVALQALRFDPRSKTTELRSGEFPAKHFKRDRPVDHETKGFH